MFETLALYLSYPFVRYATITGVLIALSSALLGVTLVLRHFSYIGDGLSHVAFGAMALAQVLQTSLQVFSKSVPRIREQSLLLAKLFSNDMILVLPITILCAVLLLCGRQKRKINGDAAIAMISVGALAIGYLLMNIYAPSANLAGDVCGTLFGSTSILTLTKGKVVLSVVLSVLVIGFFVLFYNKLFALTFDETFARATGMQVGLYQFALATVIAIIIVLAMNLVGSLLTSALILFPALSAMRVAKSFKSVTVCSALMSTACTVLGMFFSIIKGTPVGATIVFVDILLFIICSSISFIRSIV